MSHAYIGRGERQTRVANAHLGFRRHPRYSGSPVRNQHHHSPPHSSWSTIGLEAALYLALTLVITWPLGQQLTTSIPGDYGDPLFVSWVMGWVMKQLTAMLTGHTEAIAGFWHAPIFFPERNTLALSDHFMAQSAQALPVWWATGNVILSYNVVVIASFVLTALGTSLLVQQITGSRLAGALAAVMTAFNPHRLVWELGHLQTLSIQWLPLALVGLHRFIRMGSTPALTFGALSIIALNLSSGYFMLYCAPFIALFTLADMAIQGQLLDRRRWFGLVIAGVCIALVTVPFVLPYVNMQRQHGFERAVQEVIAYSAQLDQYASALPWLGITLACALFSSVVMWRAEARGWRTYAALFLLFAVLTFWLSLGPVVRSSGQPLGVPSLYAVLYTWAPGFKGVRVASRYAAVMLVFISMFSAIGAAWLMRIAPRAGRLVTLAIIVLFLWRAWPSPFHMNGVIPEAKLQLPPAYLTPLPQLPAIYQAVAGLDGNAVLAELPFGEPWYELRYMFFAIGHGKRLMNGYSGVFPASYAARRDRLADPLAAPVRASEALSGATHVIVHERAWADDTGLRIEAWLESLGAVGVAEADGARLMAIESIRRDARLDTSAVHDSAAARSTP